MRKWDKSSIHKNQSSNISGVLLHLSPLFLSLLFLSSMSSIVYKRKLAKLLVKVNSNNTKYIIPKSFCFQGDCCIVSFPFGNSKHSSAFSFFSTNKDMHIYIHQKKQKMANQTQKITKTTTKQHHCITNTIARVYQYRWTSTSLTGGSHFNFQKCDSFWWLLSFIYSTPVPFSGQCWQVWRYKQITTPSSRWFPVPGSCCRQQHRRSRRRKDGGGPVGQRDPVVAVCGVPQLLRQRHRGGKRQAGRREPTLRSGAVTAEGFGFPAAPQRLHLGMFFCCSQRL